MNQYRTRTGVVLTSICGEHLLVAAKEIRDLCPFCSQISESSAFLWKLLQHGADRDSLLRAVEKEYEIDDPAAAGQALDAFLAQMTELGYLLQEGEEAET